MTERVLVDTNIVSYVLKRDTRVLNYRSHLENRVLCVSFASVAELYRWALSSGWGEARTAQLRAMLRNYAVLPYDDRLAWEWARAKCVKGFPVSDNDAWIAATAVRHDIPLVTHNPGHFLHIPGLQVITEGV